MKYIGRIIVMVLHLCVYWVLYIPLLLVLGTTAPIGVMIEWIACGTTNNYLDAVNYILFEKSKEWVNIFDDKILKFFKAE